MSYEDFKRVFQCSDEELESRGMGVTGDSNFEAVPPKMIPELVDLNQGAAEEVVPVSEEIVQKFKIKVRGLPSSLHLSFHSPSPSPLPRHLYSSIANSLQFLLPFLSL